MHYLETYNASEGFFAYQDDLGRDDMALLMDHGIYYEFMPLEEWGKEFPETLEFRETEEGVSYALVISTNVGLWRYVVGDVVTISSKVPLRVKVAGRLTSFLNLVGEEVMVRQTDEAMSQVARELGAQVYNYMGGPRLDDLGKPIGHSWVVELKPGSLVPPVESWAQRLDLALQVRNGDYRAKRSGNMVLQPPVHAWVPSGTFDRWLRERNRLGGQHKVPRLTQDPELLEGLIEIAKKEFSPTY